MDYNLYSPSIKKHDSRTKTFDIHYLFFVALIGGIIAITILGIQNARMLRLDKKIIALMITTGIFFFINKIVILYSSFHDLLTMESGVIFSRAFGVFVYVIFYAILKKPYHEHLTTGAKTEPLLKKGAFWCFISLITEGVIIGLLKM